MSELDRLERERKSMEDEYKDFMEELKKLYKTSD